MIVYDVATKVLDTESFPQQTIADLSSGITFIVLFSQEKPLRWKEINTNTHTRTHTHTHTHTRTQATSKTQTSTKKFEDQINLFYQHNVCKAGKGIHEGTAPLFCL